MYLCRWVDALVVDRQEIDRLRGGRLDGRTRSHTRSALNYPICGRRAPENGSNVVETGTSRAKRLRRGFWHSDCLSERRRNTEEWFGVQVEVI
jgi:hypothetical protein